MNKKVFILVFVIVVLLVRSYFFLTNNKELKLPDEEGKEITYYDPSTEDRCEEIEGGMNVDCLEASELALDKYPGKVIGVKTGEIDKQVGETREETEKFKVWLFTIRLDDITTFAGQEVREVEIAVDEEGEIILNKFFPKNGN